MDGWPFGVGSGRLGALDGRIRSCIRLLLLLDVAVEDGSGRREHGCEASSICFVWRQLRHLGLCLLLLSTFHGICIGGGSGIVIGVCLSSHLGSADEILADTLHSCGKASHDVYIFSLISVSTNGS